MDTADLQRRSDVLGEFSRKEFEWAYNHGGRAPFGEHDEVDIAILDRERLLIDSMLRRAQVEAAVENMRAEP